MPLMLGLFSLRGGWNKDIAKPVLADFSLQNQRQVHTLVYDNALFSVMNGDDSEWLENDEKSILLIFVGFLTNLDTLVQKLTTAGCSIQNKESSAECILHLYKEKGDCLMQDIQRIFSLAIYDKTKGELLLANDPFGLYPLFFWKNDSGHRTQVCTQAEG